MVKRVLVAAPHGTGQWLRQRISAVVVVLYTALFFIALAISHPRDYESWRAFFGQGWLRLATLVCLLSVFYHAWLGMRDILMDYIKPTGLRLALYTVVVLALLAYAVWSVDILWGL